MFSKILIANRGEIACRIIKTARQLGILTVAVYSDADANALHVREADEKIRIGPAQAAKSYLNIAAIVEAAIASGAQAVHPGYGFLSENPDFVEAVEAAGLVFIGPSADAMRAMGLKDAAKALMEKSGVNVVPGYHGDNQEPEFLAAQAEEIGYPILIKARAGGGGKGMRLVEEPAAFDALLTSAISEGQSSFGDGRVLIEKYIAAPRHIEIQIFGDDFGNVIHLCERDCSLQRRHQKVIEEAPAPGMNDEMRNVMGAAAIRAAKAVNYSGAGTVEFIVDGSDGLHTDRFWFMEMNTRLQVEHPVTEMITGLDLVELQLQIASGEKLRLSQDQIMIDGWAFEARIYAEDPENEFLPAAGKLDFFSYPKSDVRMDVGVRAGDDISPFYDPMIAKLIVKGRDREQALSKLSDALAKVQIAELGNNVDFLGRLCTDEAFSSGVFDTGLIASKQEVLCTSVKPENLIFATAALILFDLDNADNGWRNWGRGASYLELKYRSQMVSICLEFVGSQYRVSWDDNLVELAINPDTGQNIIAGVANGLAFEFGYFHIEDRVTIFSGDADIGSHQFSSLDPLRRSSENEEGNNAIIAPMTGLLKALHVNIGDQVSKGQVLGVVEAMKMEHNLLARAPGEISEILATAGEQVEGGALLIQISD